MSSSQQHTISGYVSVKTENVSFELLPASAYCVSYVNQLPTIGFAFEGQSGEHSIGSDKRVAFSRKPYTCSLVPEGCDLYSCSDTGGEYLRIVLHRDTDSELLNVPQDSVVIPEVVRHFLHLRGLLLSGKHNPLLLSGYFARIQQLLLLSTAHTAAPINSSGDLCSIPEKIDQYLSAPLSNKELAAMVGMSSAHFSRRFKRTFGLSPHQFILQRRLAKARRMLPENGDLTEIALQCGFASHAHMSASFRQHLHCSPSELRAR